VSDGYLLEDIFTKNTVARTRQIRVSAPELNCRAGDSERKSERGILYFPAKRDRHGGKFAGDFSAARQSWKSQDRCH